MVARISKEEWYRRGGLANPDLFRKMRGNAWTYWVVLRRAYTQ